MPNNYMPGEPPNQTRTGRSGAPKEGDRRTVRIMTKPPKMVVQVFKGGRWVAVRDEMPTKQSKPYMGKKPAPAKKYTPKGKGAGRGVSKGMSLGDAIKSMQRDKPWN